MKAATVVLALALAAVCLVSVNAQAAFCPNGSPNGTVSRIDVVGDWHGYFLSTQGSTYYQAAAMVSFFKGSDMRMHATINMSDPVCTGGCPSKKPPTVDSCVVTYDVNCLDPSDATVWAFKAPPKAERPSCLSDSSPWVCDYGLTGTYYQDAGHVAAFFNRMVYEPKIPGPPLHLMPFGTFYTGCPMSQATLQGRLVRV